MKRKIYKIPSAIRKGTTPNLGFRNPEDTLIKEHGIKSGPSERLFVVDKLRVSENQHRNWMLFVMSLTVIPILYGFINSQDLLKKMQLKSITKKRRERLDEEHGIDREKYFDSMKKLDEVYRVSEKEEIEKMKQLGKDPNEVSFNY